MEVKRVRLPGLASHALLLPSGDICVLSQTENSEHAASCVDPEGNRLWRVELAGVVGYSSIIGLGCEFRAAGGTSPWLGSSLKASIQEVGPEARRAISLAALLRAGEALASFLLLPDGFLVSTCPSRFDPSFEPRVMRLDEKGQPRWVTPISIDSGESAPWTVYFVSEPLILAGHFLLAGYSNMRSGIGRWHCLNAGNGEIRWRTERIPVGYAATVGPDRFLIGAQGYGTFKTYLYDAVRGLEGEWATHGHWVVRENGEVRLVEMENVLPSRMHVSVLEPGGGIRRGPHLEGYYTSYPLITSEGELFFCRNGELAIVNEAFERHVLYGDPMLSKPVHGRMLRGRGGRLVFTIENELWLVGAGIAEMAKSPWPCGAGNTGGNPVWPA